jgi:hypothetical protein
MKLITPKIASALAIIVILALSCGCDMKPQATSVAWNGFWYDSVHPLTRGSFEANLSFGDGQASGSVTFENHTLGTFTVTGAVGEETGGYDIYERVELANGDGSAAISLLQFGSGLSNDSLMYGILSYQGISYSVYTVPHGVGIPVPSTGYVPQGLYSIGRIAIKPGATNTVWAVGKLASGTADSLFTLSESDGTASGPLSFTIPASSYSMVWSGGNLWFGQSGSSLFTLTPYSDADYSQGASLAVTNEAGIGNSLIDFVFSSTDLCVVAGFVVDYVDFYDASTGAHKGYMNGTFGDIVSACRTGDRYLFLQRSRDGSPARVLAYSSAGTKLATFVVPAACGQIATDGLSVYFVCTSPGGWILKVPASQFQ